MILSYALLERCSARQCCLRGVTAAAVRFAAVSQRIQNPHIPLRIGLDGPPEQWR